MGIACGGPAAAMAATAIAFISPPVLTTQVEAWSDVLPEMQEIWPEHYAELALNQDRVPLSPRLDAYAAMERHGVLFVMTLRDAGRLVGYLIAAMAVRIVRWDSSPPGSQTGLVAPAVVRITTQA
jgi:hypothetical protein